MPMTLNQIEKEVEHLSLNDKIKLADYLAETECLSEHDKVWMKECKRRYKAYKDGKTSARPADEVFTDALAKYKNA